MEPTTLPSEIFTPYHCRRDIVNFRKNLPDGLARNLIELAMINTGSTTAFGCFNYNNHITELNREWVDMATSGPENKRIFGDYERRRKNAKEDIEYVTWLGNTIEEQIKAEINKAMKETLKITGDDVSLLFDELIKSHKLIKAETVEVPKPIAEAVEPLVEAVEQNDTLTMAECARILMTFNFLFLVFMFYSWLASIDKRQYLQISSGHC